MESTDECPLCGGDVLLDGDEESCQYCGEPLYDWDDADILGDSEGD